MCKVKIHSAAVPLCSVKVFQMTDMWHCAVQQNATLPADALRSLALQQWVQCDVLLSATRNELCAGQQLGGGTAGEDISVQSGSALIQQFLGDASAADAQ